MKLICLFVVAVVAQGAEMDWNDWERHAVDLLQQYVRIQSVDPPADTREAANFVKGILQENGIPVRLYTSGPNGQTNLVARVAGRDRTKKPLLLLNHLDVVPVDRKAWKFDPFAATITDGEIWGRGTMDMKGIAMEQMMALVALKKSGVTPARDIVMLSTADEETNGTYGIQWMIRNHFDEINAEYVFDEGGFGTRSILAKDKLVFGIEVGEKQTLWLRVRARGTAGHGSQPIPDNANITLLAALQKAMALAPAKPHPVVEEMIRNIGEPLAANKYTAAIQANTISLTTLTSGVGSPVKVNVIPSAAEATLDCRLLPGVNFEEFISEMKARINDPRVSVEIISKPEDPGPSNSHTPLFEAVRRAILKTHPDAIVTPMLVPHGTDSNKLREEGMTAYGFTPMVLDLSTAGSMHSDTEHIPVAEFQKGIRIFYDVLSGEF
ncbi:MAG TPA: M20/M25/M40 family metallo-hydrolase [Bryobacteraceae bacterium]|nr:M20/M25/M40 family metallo-hydrolase [Bryobacteraceae bacterium]